MDDVNDLLRVFGDERYMLAFTGPESSGTVGEGYGRKILSKAKQARVLRAGGAKGSASVVLHKDATGADAVKSLLALGYLHEELAKAGIAAVGATRVASVTTSATSRSRGLKAERIEVGRSSQESPVSGIIPINGDIAGGVPGIGNAGDSGSRGAGYSGGKGPQQHYSYAQVLHCLRTAKRRADEGFPGFLEALQSLGWNTEKFMFGNIKSRVEWRM